MLDDPFPPDPFPRQRDFEAPPTVHRTRSSAEDRPQIIGGVPAGRDRTRTVAATRYLCAAAHLDQQFRTGVLRWVLDQEHRAVAPSYSIDIIPILKHCLAGRRRELRRDAATTAIIFVALLFAFREVLALLAFVYALLFLRRCLVHLGRRNPAGAAVQSVFVLIFAFIGFQTAVGLGGVLLSGDPVAALARGFSAAVLTVLGAFATGVWYRLSIHQTILTSLTEPAFDPARAPEPPEHFRPRLAYLDKAQHGNVTVYAKAARNAPFVGSGVLKDVWSVVIPLIPAQHARADDDQEPVPLTLAALYRRMRHALMSLNDPQAPPGDRILGLSLQDRIFVSGLMPAGHPLIDENGEPRFRVDHEELQRLAEVERNRATHHLTVRISGWDGELDVTVFMYFSIRGRMLYFEFLGATLPEIKPVYQSIDSFERMTLGVIARASLGSIKGTPGMLANAPLNLTTPLGEFLRRRLDGRAQQQQINNHLAFDYGALQSVRSFGADWDHENLFHELDSERYLQIVKRRAVAAIAEVLEDAGYDTDEFMNRANVNIDNSTHTYGDIHATNSAVAINGGQASYSAASAQASQPPGPRGSGGAGRSGGPSGSGRSGRSRGSGGKP